MHNSDSSKSGRPGAPKKDRRCRRIGETRRFKPAGIPGSELKHQILYSDEFEAMRLCDLEKQNQIEAAETMKISRGTVQRLLQSGRAKVTQAILQGEMIILDEGEENDE